MIPVVFKIFILLPVLILLLFGIIVAIVLMIKQCFKHPWIAVILILLLLPFVFVVIRVPGPVTIHRPIVSVESSLVQSGDTTAAIWLPGIEDEFEANIYPSKLSAVRSLGLRISETVREVFSEQTPPSNIILFQGSHDRDLLDEFGSAIAHSIPETKWTIEPETVAVQTDQVGIRLDVVKVQTHPAPWLNKSESNVTSGTIQASVLAADRQASITADFVEKPWVDDFSSFLNAKPKARFIIAKSADSCMTQAEANNQAIEDACAQLTKMLGQASRRLSGIPAHLISRVNSSDILEGDLILDRFVQSFKGTAGRIWRQALLIDASAEKLSELAHRKAIMARAEKMTLARMFFSVVGLIVLITIVYAFLNAATKGYYVWSLRIAGIVLALVMIILFLV